MDNNQYFLDGKVEQPAWLQSLDDFVLTFQHPESTQKRLIIYGETENDNTLIYFFGNRQMGSTPPIPTKKRDLFSITSQTKDQIGISGRKGDIEENQESLLNLCQEDKLDAIYYKHTITNPLVFLKVFHECVAFRYLLPQQHPNELIERIEGAIETAKEESKKNEITAANGQTVSYE